MYKRIAILFIVFSFCSISFIEEEYYGSASYYADKFQGKKTSSGELYDKNEYTCAHRTLPFGTLLEVTNLANDSTVIVKVNDRGPYSKSRLIDVSKAAAIDLDMIRGGVIKVKIEVLPEDYEAPADTVYLDPEMVIPATDVILEDEEEDFFIHKLSLPKH
jgi:rare lipoprotein A